MDFNLISVCKSIPGIFVSFSLSASHHLSLPVSITDTDDTFTQMIKCCVCVCVCWCEITSILINIDRLRPKCIIPILANNADNKVNYNEILIWMWKCTFQAYIYLSCFGIQTQTDKTNLRASTLSNISSINTQPVHLNWHILW